MFAQINTINLYKRKKKERVLKKILIKNTLLIYSFESFFY